MAFALSAPRAPAGRERGSAFADPGPRLRGGLPAPRGRLRQPAPQARPKPGPARDDDREKAVFADIAWQKPVLPHHGAAESGHAPRGRLPCPRKDPNGCGELEEAGREVGAPCRRAESPFPAPAAARRPAGASRGAPCPAAAGRRRRAGARPDVREDRRGEAGARGGTAAAPGRVHAMRVAAD